MTHRLSSHIHAAVCGEDLVILDQRQGSYACLPGCAPLIALSAGTSTLRACDGALLQALVDLGACEAGAGEARFTLPPPARDLAGEIDAAVRPMAMGLAWAGLAGAYRRLPFGRLIDLAQSQALRAFGGEAQIADLARSFARMLPWVPAQGACLYRSWLLLNFLRWHGVSACWVFGVQTYSFEAHCWLQARDLVLDDHVEHVAGFAPIMTLSP